MVVRFERRAAPTSPSPPPDPGPPPKPTGPPRDRSGDDFGWVLAAYEGRVAAIREEHGLSLSEAERRAHRELVASVDDSEGRTTMGGIRQALFLHQIERGHARAERAAEAVSRDYPGLVISVEVFAETVAPEMGKEPTLHRVMIGIYVDEGYLHGRCDDLECVVVPADWTSCVMERQIRHVVN